MKIVLAPEGFRQYLTSGEVCLAMEKAIKRIAPEIELIKVPIADGGEGSVDTFVSATGGRIIKTLVQDPMGRLITGFFGLSGDKSTAIIETTTASGLQLLAENERNPLKTSTFGTGQLIKAALDEEVKKIIICTGPSAAVDGGLGMAKALGIKFLNANGFELGEGGQELNLLTAIDVSGLDPRIDETEFIVVCNSTQPMTGPEGSASFYGSNKETITEQLDQGLVNLCKIIESELSKDLTNLPGAGIAGGLCGGMVSFLNGKMMSATDFMIEASGLKEKLQDADLLFSGGGRLEHHSDLGRSITYVGEIARSMNVPLILVSGVLGSNYETLYEAGISGLAPILTIPAKLDASEVAQLIIDTTARTLKIFLAGLEAK